MKKLLTLMLALCLCASCLPALAETTPPTASGYMAEMDKIATSIGATLTWQTQPFSAAEGYTLHICQTLDGNPVLVCLEDALVMIGATVPYDPADAPLPAASWAGQFTAAILPLAAPLGMTEDDVYDLLLNGMGEFSLAEEIAAVSAEGGAARFTIAGYDAAVLRYEEGGVTQLCLYIYTAPELMPQLQ